MPKTTVLAILILQCSNLLSKLPFKLQRWSRILKYRLCNYQAIQSSWSPNLTQRKHSHSQLPHRSAHPVIKNDLKKTHHFYEIGGDLNYSLSLRRYYPDRAIINLFRLCTSLCHRQCRCTQCGSIFNGRSGCCGGCFHSVINPIISP